MKGAVLTLFTAATRTAHFFITHRMCYEIKGDHVYQLSNSHNTFWAREGWSRYWLIIERTLLMTSIRIVLLVRKLWSPDSAGWSGHVLHDLRSAVHVIMWPTSSDFELIISPVSWRVWLWTASWSRASWLMDSHRMKIQRTRTKRGTEGCLCRVCSWAAQPRGRLYCLLLVHAWTLYKSFT